MIPVNWSYSPGGLPVIDAAVIRILVHITSYCTCARTRMPSCMCSRASRSRCQAGVQPSCLDQFPCSPMCCLGRSKAVMIPPLPVTIERSSSITIVIVLCVPILYQFLLRPDFARTAGCDVACSIIYSWAPSSGISVLVPTRHGRLR